MVFGIQSAERSVSCQEGGHLVPALLVQQMVLRGRKTKRGKVGKWEKEMGGNLEAQEQGQVGEKVAGYEEGVLWVGLEG